MLPAFRRVPRSRSEAVRRQLMAGLSLAAFVIPERVSHAHLLGLYPRVGLYSSVAATIGCAVFGRPRFRVAGTNPVLAILMAGDIGALAGQRPALAASMAALTAAFAGLIAIAAWALRLAFLSRLMSKSALIGLNVGAGLLVIGLQLPRLCGLDVASGSFFAQLVESSRRLSEANRASCAFGVGVLAILVLGERLLPGRPIPLVVLCSSLLLSRLAGLSGVGVTLLGVPPPGTASASLLAAAQAFWPRLLLLAVPVFLLAHVQDISAAREVDARRPEGLSPTHELLANGATNLAAGLLGGMPVAGSGLPSSLSKEEGARSTLALAVSGVLILLVVLFPAPLRFVPEAMLSANLIRHALLLIDIGALLRLFRGARREFTTAATTAVGVLLLGPLFGVLIGVVVTVCDASEHMHHRLAAALGSALGRTPRAVRQDGAGNHSVDRVMISHLDASVLFLNAESLRRMLVEQLNQELERRPVDLLVLDLERSRVMDVSGAEMIHELQDVLARRGIVVKIAGARTPIIRFLAAAEPERFTTPGRSAAAVIHDWRRSTP